MSGTPKEQQSLITASEIDVTVWSLNGTASAHLVK